MGECQTMCTSDANVDRENRNRMEQSAAIEYDGRRFIISDKISFENQATFTKVEQAARAFCQKNNISPFHIPLVSRIVAYRHEFIFEEIWNRMSQNERTQFLEDLNSISHDLMDSFYFHFVLKRLRSKDHSVKAKMAFPPKTTKEVQISMPEKTALAKYGQNLLIENKVAIVFMCAGSSSRFEGQDKFLAPFTIGLQTCTILDFLFMRLKNNVQGNRHIPIVINCNEGNIGKIQKYMKEKGYFGFNPSKFRFTTTYSLAVFDQNGKYCLNEKMRLIKKPSGTAACAESLLSPGVNKFLHNQGVQYIYFSGMENLLENPADPVFLGTIWCEKRKAGAKCVNPIFESEIVPRYFTNEDHGLNISLLGPEEQGSVSNLGILGALPVAINSMVFEFKWLTQIVTDYNNSLFLAQKYRVIAKSQKVYNIKNWQLELRSCYSFEKDIRDFLSCVHDPMLFKVERSLEYAPICSKTESYCLPMAVQHFGARLHSQLQEKKSESRMSIMLGRG